PSPAPPEDIGQDGGKGDEAEDHQEQHNRIAADSRQQTWVGILRGQYRHRDGSQRGELIVWPTNLKGERPVSSETRRPVERRCQRFLSKQRHRLRCHECGSPLRRGGPELDRGFGHILTAIIVKRYLYATYLERARGLRHDQPSRDGRGSQR